MRDCNTEALLFPQSSADSLNQRVTSFRRLLSIQKSWIPPRRTRDRVVEDRPREERLGSRCAEGKHPMIRASGAPDTSVSTPQRAPLRVSPRREDTASKNAWHAGWTHAKMGAKRSV
ncbi:hypothetical protein MTO96_018938 [Rhipicephalus appendiculatus]